MFFQFIGMLFVLLCAGMFGSGDFLSGISSRKIGESLTLLTAFFFEVVFALIYWFIFDHTFAWQTNLTLIVAIGGIFQGLGLFFFFKAMTLDKISLIAPIFSTYALLSVLYGIFILHDQITIPKLLGIIVILFGAILVSTDFSFRKEKINFFKSKGIRYALLGTLFASVAFLTLTQGLKGSHFYFYNSIYTFMTFITAILLNAKSFRLKQIKWNKSVIGIPFTIGFLQTTGNVAYGLGLQFINSSLGSAISGIFPAFTVLLGFFVLKEKLAHNQILGILCIIVGLFLTPL